MKKPSDHDLDMSIEAMVVSIRRARKRNRDPPNKLRGDRVRTRGRDVEMMRQEENNMTRWRDGMMQKTGAAPSKEIRLSCLSGPLLYCTCRNSRVA